MKPATYLTAFIFAGSMAFAQVPQHLNYQGRVSVNGVNFTGNGQFKFALVDGGTTFGTTAAATATVDENGVVTGVYLDNSGTNYTEPPTITFGGPGNGATATAHLDLGIVSFVTVTNGGSGYTTPPTVTFSAPSTSVIYNHLWNNDGSQNGDAPPTAAVTVPVVNGLYSVALGDPAQGMVPFNQGIFSIPLYLRVWFSDGAHGFQQLSPDQALATAPYAARAKLAETVPDGSITSASLAAGAVTTANLADGAVSFAKLADGAVSGVKLSDGSVGASKLADGSVDPSKLAPETVTGLVQNVLDTPTITSLNGGVVISPDPESTSLASSGYVKIGSQAFSAESWAGLGFTPPPVPATLQFPQSIWTGTEMLVFGNLNGLIHAYKFIPDSLSWVELGSVAGSLSGAKMVRAGNEILFWGVNFVSQANTNYPFSWPTIAGVSGGVGFRIAEGTWRILSTSNQPDARLCFNSVWTGSRMIVWGGVASLSDFADQWYYNMKAQPNGGIYDPIANSWTSFSGGPIGRTLASAVWVGSEMVVWGGAEWVASNDPELGGGDFVPRDTGAAFNPDTGVWRDIPTAGAPAARYGHAAVVNTGGLVHIFGGSSNAAGATFNWFGNSWTAMPTAGQPQGKFLTATAGTGTKVFVWGGATTCEELSEYYPDGDFSTFVNSGAIFDQNSNTWTPITSTNSPEARMAPACVWTGSKAILYGGEIAEFFGNTSHLGDTHAWEESANRWENLNGALAPRRLAKSVWTGSELLYWGGESGSGQMRSGGRISLADNTHHVIPLADAPSARTGHSAVWTGTEMLVWGGQSQTDGSYPADAAKYRRSTNAWTAVTATDAPSARKDHTAVWTGTEMIVWGGVGVGAVYPATGGRYNPTVNEWQALSESGSPPAPRADHTAIWTGTKMIIWGGRDGSGPLGTGAIYTPATGEWTTMPTLGAPSPRYLHTATWTGTDIFIWGGIDSSNNSPADGARYSTTNNTWHPIATLNAPSARAFHSAVWSGSELIVWGGRSGSAGAVLGDGGRYSLALESWQPLTGTAAPSARWGQTSMWAGTGMITLFGQAANGTHPSDAFRYTPPATVYYYLKLNP